MYFVHVLLAILLVSVHGKEIGKKINAEDPEKTDANQIEETTTEGTVFENYSKSLFLLSLIFNAIFSCQDFLARKFKCWKKNMQTLCLRK